MIREQRLFSDDILNIFTDASYNNEKKKGCAGAICVNGNTIVETRLQVICDTTSNYCEMYAILMGIDLAVMHRKKNIRFINLFSDSNISLMSISGWLFRWIENARYSSKNNQYYLVNTENQPVKNQDLIFAIVNTIINNNLEISLYHQYSHIKNTTGSLIKAKDHFVKRNNIINDIENNLIKKISYYNNLIDDITRQCLIQSEQTSNNRLMVQPLYNPFNVEMYMKLINHIYPNKE